jgi:hypothetical protein
MTWHCGVFLYHKNERTSQLFRDWYQGYKEQRNNWPFDEELYPRSLQPWDTWTFWRLLNLDGYRNKINIDRFPDDARWNFHNLRYSELNGKSIIIYHNTMRKNKDHERDITE